MYRELGLDSQQVRYFSLYSHAETIIGTDFRLSSQRLSKRQHDKVTTSVYCGGKQFVEVQSDSLCATLAYANLFGLFSNSQDLYSRDLCFKS